MKYSTVDTAPWVTAFTPMVDQVIETQALPVPLVVRAYLVAFLAAWAQRSDFVPEPSFAERWMTLRTAEETKEFADQCLFCVSLFPNMGERRGIPAGYYSDLGSMAYAHVYRSSGNPLFQLLSRGFDPCAHVLHYTVSLNKTSKWMTPFVG